MAALIASLIPMAAAAQGPAAADAVEADSVAAAQTSGPMTVQRMHTTFMIAPDFKVTRFDGRTGQMAGVYGGMLLDDQWLIGAGGYWLTNGSAGRDLSYGGGIFGWTTPVDRPIGFSVRSLIGWGEARLPVTVTTPAYTLRPDPGAWWWNGTPSVPSFPPITVPGQTYQARVRDSFFVAEPQADVLFRVASWGRLDAGVGYRAVGAADQFGNRIRGVTASISLQVGNF